MNKNMFKTMILSLIMILGITSICFADVMMPRYTPLGMAVYMLQPIFGILLIVAGLKFLAFYLLSKTSKIDEEKKEKYEQKIGTAKYELLFVLALLTASVMDVLAIFPLAFVIVSLFIRVIKKDKQKSYELLKNYFKGIIALLIGLYIILGIRFGF